MIYGKLQNHSFGYKKHGAVLVDFAKLLYWSNVQSNSYMLNPNFAWGQAKGSVGAKANLQTQRANTRFKR